jgi:hypothetical protein
VKKTPRIILVLHRNVPFVVQINLAGWGILQHIYFTVFKHQTAQGKSEIVRTYMAMICGASPVDLTDREVQM